MPTEPFDGMCGDIFVLGAKSAGSLAVATDVIQILIVFWTPWDEALGRYFKVFQVCTSKIRRYVIKFEMCIGAFIGWSLGE